MSENNINALRAELFETLRGVRSGSVDIEKAKAVSELSQVIINTAKVEIDHMKLAGGSGSGFLASAPALSPPPKTTPTLNGSKTVTQEGGVTVTRHQLK
jgi:hypothetical protein